MTRSSQKLVLAVAIVFLTNFLMLSLADTSLATLVGAQSDGDDLAGGRITVNFAQQGPLVAPIVVGGPGQGTASILGQFTFSVTGDTFLSDWKLSNDTTFDIIRSVEFNLAGTSSQPDPNGPVHSPGVLFDDNSLPSTPDGFAGRKGAVQVNVGAPFIINSFEITPWTDVMNAGDEFVGEVIEYEAFGPGLTSVWRDDTDIVGFKTEPELPEPSSVVLVMLATVAIGCINRRR